MSKMNCVLAGLALAAAGAFGVAPQAAVAQTVTAQAATAQTTVPAAFDHCYAEYRMCMQDTGDDEYCLDEYRRCNQA